MSKYLAGLAALALMGAAALPLPAGAAERQAGISNPNVSTDMSAHWRRHYVRRHYVRHYWGPRYYYGPRYGYYGYPRYSYYGGPYYGYGYPYYRPRPFVSFGVGPFGFVF